MKAIKNSLCVIVILFWAWFFASWCDVIADNCYPNPQHHPLNMFVLMTRNH